MLAGWGGVAWHWYWHRHLGRRGAAGRGGASQEGQEDRARPPPRGRGLLLGLSPFCFDGRRYFLLLLLLLLLLPSSSFYFSLSFFPILPSAPPAQGKGKGKWGDRD